MSGQLERRIPPARGELTDLFLAFLTAELAGLLLVGDADKPATGGWPSEPDPEADFVPYTVLSTGQAVAQQARETLATQHTSWVCSYTLDTFGAARAQSDWGADKARFAAVEFGSREVVLDEVPWTVQLVMFSQLGAVTPDRSTDPPQWHTVDTANMLITRGRA